MNCDVCRKQNVCPWGFQRYDFPSDYECKHFEENSDLKKGLFLCVRCGKRHKKTGATLNHGVGIISDDRIEKKFKKEWENGSSTDLCKKCTDEVLDFICNWKG